VKASLPHLAAFLIISWTVVFGADSSGLKSRTTYSAAYGKTKHPAEVDVQRELPRYPAVEPDRAVETWKLRKGFQIQLAAHEPQVRDPIAMCFDEYGRMFVCEMIDYSEMRDVDPHLGRISVLEDKDGDGIYESSRVFADNLPWPTGLVWVSGGLYVGATPDIWRLEDRDNDGRAEFRERVFTGFGTGLKILNVQGLLNSFQWGPDNRVHVLAGGGNRGVVTCLKRPELSGQELGGRDFWFDPFTLEFGTEKGGAQYGMSFDNFGRKFGCSNSDHLQTWVYDGDPGERNAMALLPAARRSIAVDGGAAEVFRISPDEPWRIIRTRWRVAGTVPGAIEGGGRVSGYFTGATGTTIYRGDAYGEGFVNNSFTGDAGGQLVHRKVIRAAEDGVSLVGERPVDEKGFEFAASEDTWVRVVNFSNAPDGCLYVCDMYREVIEHPWSIPDEIKRHLDLNQGNDRGRIYRIVPDGWVPSADKIRRGRVGDLSSEHLVALLSHANGWHRDTAQRLLVERGDTAVVPQIEGVVEHGNSLAKLHGLGVLRGLRALEARHLERALGDMDAHVRERAVVLAHEIFSAAKMPSSLTQKLSALSTDTSQRVRFVLALALGTVLQKSDSPELTSAFLKLAQNDHAHEWIGPAVLSAPADIVSRILFAPFTKDPQQAEKMGTFVSRLLEMKAATAPAHERVSLIRWVSDQRADVAWIGALGGGFKRAGISLAKADEEGRLHAVFVRAAERAENFGLGIAERLDALEVLAFAPFKETHSILERCLQSGQPDEVQLVAMKIYGALGGSDVTPFIIKQWSHYGPKMRESAVQLLMARAERAKLLLEAIASGTIPPADLSPAQVQALVTSKDTAVAAAAKGALASVLPRDRTEVLAKYQSAVALKGDAKRGESHYSARCMACHRAAGRGVPVGPDLETVKSRGRDGLLGAILDPAREVAAQYVLYSVQTHGGETFTGLISEDAATQVVLKTAGGLEQKIQRSAIRGMTSTGLSLMPEGLETGLAAEDMADLLAFIEGLK
jgi:putative membrane-bound dehydrogenase-like protein